MADTQWSRANRAAAALQAHVDEAQGLGESYGDEGSDTFREAVVLLLVDLKHLLYRADYRLLLEDLAQEAVDRYAIEADELPEGSDEDDYDPTRDIGHHRLASIRNVMREDRERVLRIIQARKKFNIGDRIIFRESETGDPEPGVVTEVVPADEQYPNGGLYRVLLDGAEYATEVWVYELERDDAVQG